MQASLARPSVGGDVRDSLSASPSSPVMAFFFARGWTLTANVTPPLDSWMANQAFFPNENVVSTITKRATTMISGLCRARASPMLIINATNKSQHQDVGANAEHFQTPDRVAVAKRAAHLTWR